MAGLREVAHCVGTLNPHKEEGLRLVMEMLKQVLELHPDLNTLHIGADEVRSSLLGLVLIPQVSDIFSCPTSSQGVHVG